MKHPSATEEELTEEGGHDALFMGLGDAVIPGILIASAAHFIDVPLVENFAVFDVDSLRIERVVFVGCCRTEKVAAGGWHLVSHCCWQPKSVVLAT